MEKMAKKFESTKSMLAPGNDESTFEELVEETEAAQLADNPPGSDASTEQSDWLPAKTDRAVGKVNAIAHESIERGMEAIGHYLFVEAFNSDLEAVKSKNPRKRAYFGAICEHPDLRVDPRRLGEAVKAAALSQLLKHRGLELPNLTFTHKVHLARIPDQEKMVALAIEANEKGYKVSELRDIVAGLLPSKKSGLGKVIVKAIRKPNEMLANEEHMKMLSEPSNLIEQFGEAERIGLRIASAETRGQLIEYCDFLQQLEASLFDIELAERQKLLPAE
jgi:hypothetical protein